MRIVRYKDGNIHNHEAKNLVVIEIDLPKKHPKHPKSRKELLAGWQKETSTGIGVIPRPFRKKSRKTKKQKTRAKDGDGLRSKIEGCLYSLDHELKNGVKPFHQQIQEAVDYLLSLLKKP